MLGYWDVGGWITGFDRSHAGKLEQINRIHHTMHGFPRFLQYHLTATKSVWRSRNRHRTTQFLFLRNQASTPNVPFYWQQYTHTESGRLCYISSHDSYTKTLKSLVTDSAKQSLPRQHIDAAAVPHSVLYADDDCYQSQHKEEEAEDEREADTAAAPATATATATATPAPTAFDADTTTDSKSQS